MVVTIGIIGVSAIGIIGAKEIDRVATSASVQMVDSVLRDRQRNLARLVIDYAWWDETVENLITDPDLDWADINIGENFFEGFDIPLTLAIGGADTLVYVSDNGKRHDPSDYAGYLPGLSNIVAAARKSPVKTPEPSAGFVKIGNITYIVAAGIITPFEKWHPTYGSLTHKPVLVSLIPLDEDRLRIIAESYSLSDLTLHTSDVAAPAQTTTLQLRDFEGNVIANVAWKIEMPGSTMVENFTPGAIVILLIVIGVGVLFFRATTAANTYLHQQNDRLSTLSGELQKANSELESLSFRDGLTEIGNRRRFDEAIVTEWRRSARERLPLSLIFIDVDLFKNFNSEYGHAVGDNCLRYIAQAISASSNRASDTVARYGGEEFVILLPGVMLDGAVKIAETARSNVDALNIPHAGSDVADHVTISIGVASMLPAEGGDWKDLVKKADQKLYQAKSAGRNNVAS